MDGMILYILLFVVVICVLLVGGAVALLAAMRSSNLRHERRIREQGQPMLTTLMMANTSLHDPDGRASVPGVVVFGFYRPNSKLPETLRAIGERCYDLYTSPNLHLLSPPLRAFSLLLKDDIYSEARRNLVPAEVAGSATVYVADLWIRRDYLPADWQQHRVLACAVTGQDQGEIALIPPDDSAALEIYAAAGVTQLRPLDPAAANYGGTATMPRPKPAPALDKQSRGLLSLVGILMGGLFVCAVICGVGLYMIRAAFIRQVVEDAAIVAAEDAEPTSPARSNVTSPVIRRSLRI